jgi:hypothetical protein
MAAVGNHKAHGRPFCAPQASDGDVEDFPVDVLDHEEDVKRFEQKALDAEEAGRLICLMHGASEIFANARKGLDRGALYACTWPRFWRTA